MSSSTVSKCKSSADRWRDDISHVSAKWFSNGCCGQSLVFPRRIIPRLADWFRRVKDGHARRRIEEFAEHAKLASFAFVPSVFQHIGGESSHEADLPKDVRHGMSLAQRVWNFGFEEGQWSTAQLAMLSKQVVKRPENL